MSKETKLMIEVWFFGIFSIVSNYLVILAYFKEQYLLQCFLLVVAIVMVLCFADARNRQDELKCQDK